MNFRKIKFPGIGCKRSMGTSAGKRGARGAALDASCKISGGSDRNRRRGRGRGLAAWFVLAWALLMPSLAQAQSDEVRKAASQYFKDGEELMRQCQYKDAIQKYSLALKTLPHPTMFYYLGLAHLRNGTKEDALKYMKKYLHVVDHGDLEVGEEQYDFVQNTIATLENEVRVELETRREREQMERLYGSVMGLLDIMQRSRGAELTAPYMQRFVRVMSKDVAQRATAAPKGAMAALQELERALRAELERAPSRGSRALRTTGWLLGTTGLIAVGMGLHWSISSSGPDDGPAFAILLGSGGALSFLMGAALYKAGQPKKLRPLSSRSMVLLPAVSRRGGGVAITGRF